MYESACCSIESGLCLIHETVAEGHYLTRQMDREEG